MKNNTEIYVHKAWEISIRCTQLAVEANNIPRKQHLCTFHGPIFPPLHSLSICPCKPKNMFLHHFRLTSMYEFSYFLLLRIPCGAIKQTPLAPLLMRFFFCRLFRVLLISQGLFHRHICQDRCSPFLSSNVTNNEYLPNSSNWLASVAETDPVLC
jgi:hypothetical protein